VYKNEPNGILKKDFGDSFPLLVPQQENKNLGKGINKSILKQRKISQVNNNIKQHKNANEIQEISTKAGKTAIKKIIK
jgi:hypothetical protein